MIPLTKEKKSLIKSSKNAMYAMESFVRMKMMQIIKREKRLKITAIT